MSYEQLLNTDLVRNLSHLHKQPPRGMQYPQNACKMIAHPEEASSGWFSLPMHVQPNNSNHKLQRIMIDCPIYYISHEKKSIKFSKQTLKDPADHDLSLNQSCFTTVSCFTTPFRPRKTINASTSIDAFEIFLRL